MQRVATDRLASKLDRIGSFLARDVGRFKEQLSELETEINSQAVPVPGDEFHRRLADAFQESQDACRTFELENGDDLTFLRDTQAGFRQETDAWFQHSWIAQRSRTKPSGFAGDFEMLIKLYDQETSARGLGGYLDLCILNLPLACAVRTRLRAAREFLLGEMARRDGEVRVLDVACGPCREYLDWPERSGNSHMNIVAIDNDPRALEWVNAHVVPGLPPQIHLQATRYNALRTRSATATTRLFGKFDIIYSVGLFDYLPDEQLIPILAGLHDSLQDEGVMYIAFKDATRYDKTPYQWHLDWFFFQRTEEDCLRLYEAAGFNPAALDVTRDETGIILNFVSRKDRRAIERTDMAESVIKRLKKHYPTASKAELGQ